MKTKHEPVIAQLKECAIDYPTDFNKGISLEAQTMMDAADLLEAYGQALERLASGIALTGRAREDNAWAISDLRAHIQYARDTIEERIE